MNLADSIKLHINRSELESLCALRMAADPAPVDDTIHDQIGDVLDRAAAEFGYTDWVQAAHAIPHGIPGEITKPASPRLDIEAVLTEQQRAAFSSEQLELLATLGAPAENVVRFAELLLGEAKEAQADEPETVLLVFQGYSDDTFGEYGTQNVDFCDNGSGKPIEWLITSPNGDEQLLVVGQYRTGSATGWVVGVAPWDPESDDETMPDWPISIEQSERAYSPALFVSAPKGSTLRCLQEPVQKNADFFED